jgi:hypothetical protein
VRENSSFPYAALSDVWGGVESFQTTTANVSTLEQRDRIEAFANEIPEMIRNAFILTRSIGIRYQWVDAMYISFQQQHSCRR